MTQKQEIKDYHESLKLGDKLEWLFKVTGIKWLVKKIHPNCNCERRKDYLNEIKVKRK
jgi:hypothetical protein